MAAATYLELPAGEKLALIALAEHSDENGQGAYPGNELLMRQASLKRRALTTNLAALERRQLVSRVAYAAGGRGHAVVWAINAPEVYRLANEFKDERKGAANAPVYERKGAADDPLSGLKGASDDIKGARNAPPTLNNPHGSPPGERAAIKEAERDKANGANITSPVGVGRSRYRANPERYDAIANGTYSEGRTDPSPPRNDPETCPHPGWDTETGLCVGCRAKIKEAV
jgi:hypothetical protein